MVALLLAPWTGSEHQLDSNPSIAPSAGHRRTGSFGGSSAVGTPTRSDTLSVDGKSHLCWF